MKFSNTAILFVFIILLIQSIGFGQNTYISQDIIDIKSGFSPKNISGIVKDSKGFVWISSYSGLYKWDGISVREFKHVPGDSLSLADNSIHRHCMIYDSILNKILIGTHNKLCIFDPENEISQNITINYKNEGIAFDINSLFLDRQRELWLSSNNGIARFDFRENTFEFFRYTNETNNVSIDLVNDIRVIKQDIKNDSILWLGSIFGLLKFNKISKKIELFINNFDIDKLNNFVLMTLAPDRRMYLGTWNSDMVVFNTKTQKFESTIGPLSTANNLFFPSAVRPFMLKSNNEIWISSIEGIGYYNTENRKIHIIKTFKNFAGHKYESDVVVKIGKDLWIGSEYGLKRITLKSNFQNFFLPPDDNYWFLPYNLYEDTLNHKLYLSFTKGQGLYYFDLLDNSFHTIKCPESLSKVFAVRGIKYFTVDTLLVVCSESIYKLSLRDRKMLMVKLDRQQNYNFTNFEIDEKGDMWLTTKRLGLVRMNWENNTLRPVKKIIDFFEKKNLFPSLGKISIDKNNRIWWSNSSFYGYYVADKDLLKTFKTNDNSIISFYNDKTDTIWVGTTNKFLGFIDIKQPDKGLQYFFKDKSGSIFDISRDINGIFYFLTSKGIEKWIEKDSQSVVFGKESGLIKFDKWSNRDPTAMGKLLKLADERFVIQYRRGIGLFYPDSLNNSFEDFTPYINAIKIFNKDLHPVKSLDLNYNQNSITFEYSALAMGNGNDIRFLHRLSGVSKDWESSNFHTVNYSNLSPGKYHFFVKAYNKSVPGHVKYASVDIFIHPPLWATWYAYLIYFLVLVTIVYLFYRFYYKRKIAQTELKRITELEEMKSEFYTNITHEFRTPLTVILGMTEQINNSLNIPCKKVCIDPLKMIRRNSRKLLDLVNQLLDMAKIEDGKYQINNSKGDIVWFLGFMVENFHSYAQSKNIELIYYPEFDKLIMDFDLKVMERIISNLLGNAIKFSKTGGKVIVHLNKIKTNDNSLLQIKIKDEGIGIEKSKVPFIFDRFYQIDTRKKNRNEGTGIGLSMVKNLVDLMDGTIEVESKVDKGSTFILVFPITNIATVSVEDFKHNEPLIDEDESGKIESDSDDKDMVLIVEDNQDIAKYISSSISDKYSIRYANNGRSGLKLAINIVPDIIISDVMMPVMDGFEMLEKLKKDIRTSHIPIIMLTARVAEEDKLKGLKYGAEAYLTKPFNIEELNIRLEQLILLRKKLQEKFKDPINWNKIKRSRSKSIEQEFLVKIKENINDNINNSFLNSEFLAKLMRMSDTQLYRKLKALTGKSTAIFIRHIRLQKAKELLETTDLNISEIAYDTGFNDPAYFSRVFKEEYGVSPRRLRGG